MLMAFAFLTWVPFTVDNRQFVPKHVEVFLKYNNKLYSLDPGAIFKDQLLKDGTRHDLLVSILLHQCDWQNPKRSTKTYEFSALSRVEEAQPNFKMNAGFLWHSDNRYSYGYSYQSPSFGGGIRRIPLEKIRTFEVPEEKWEKMTEQKKEELGRRLTRNNFEFGSFAFEPLWKLRFEYWVNKLKNNQDYQPIQAMVAAEKQLDSEATCNDFIPIDRGQLFLFTIFEKNLFVHMATIKKGIDTELPAVDKNPKYTVTPRFFEPFKAFRIREEFFFVTKSGGVFVWKKLGKKDQKMEPVWLNDKNPVQVVFEDLDAGKVYAFAQNLMGKAGEGIYFELGNEKEFKAYKLNARAQADLPLSLSRGLQFYQIIEEGRTATKKNNEKE